MNISLIDGVIFRQEVKYMRNFEQTVEVESENNIKLATEFIENFKQILDK